MIGGLNNIALENGTIDLESNEIPNLNDLNKSDINPLDAYKAKTYKKLDLSIVIITCEKDKPFLQDLFLSLPDGIEIVLVNTIQGVGENTKNNQMSGQNYILSSNYYYESLNFSELRNYALSLANRGWVLQLDSDERLLWNTYQTNRLPQFFDLLKDIPETVGGFYIHVLSELPPDKKYTLGRLVDTPIVRLFRNKPEFKYIYRCHEQISPSIVEAGYELYLPQMNMPRIEHVGYYSQDTDKLLRNAKLIAADLAEYNEDYQYYMMWETLSAMNNSGLIKKAIYGNNQ